MVNQMQKCFDEVQFNRFLENQSDELEEARILAHIATCQQCQSTLEKLSGHDEVLSEIKNHLVGNETDLVGAETRDRLETQDRQRDLKKIQQLLGPTDNPDMIGRIGGYEVCGMIGRGSAGVVVKALDTRLNRYVAIKLLAPVYSHNGSSRRRFEREGRAIASVKDPNVIPVHTVDEYQGTPYIVMQYVPDGSLDHRIEKKGPLKTSEVVCVAMQVAKGLAAAHERGIVHRDVKPANVLLERGVDSAMVTDFGLARVVDEATMTHSGAISGTPQYMSPEQARGESVDQRSDLFSLGSVMYATCTGHSPFRAESVFGVIKRVCESEPRPIRETNPETPEWLEAFVAKLHAKNRDNRFDSADEVADLLNQELAHLQAPTMVAEPARDWWIKPMPPKKLEPQPPVKVRSASFGANLKYGVAAIVLTVAGLFAWSMFTSGNGEPGGGVSSFAGASSSSSSPISLLALVKQENEKLPRFENTIETTIDVENGGQLFLRTNLGTLEVSTHDKPTVEMKLVHTVAASDQERAAKLFKAMRIEYDVNNKKASQAGLAEQKDAAIIATFPTREITEEEIEAADDLEALKEQLLIRNNSHFRNASFELLIPQEFNIDLQTSAGPITVGDVGGWAKLASRGGHIEADNISGTADMQTNGGHITTGNIGADANLKTMGGHVETGNVEGKLVVFTQGGHVRADHVAGQAILETRGGNIELAHAKDFIQAKSTGGGVKVWMAESKVDLNASAGSINVNFVGQPQGDSTLVAGAGAIKVGYVEGTKFDITASSGLGRVSGPFENVKKSKKLSYQLNGGENKLSASAGTGSIKFRVVDAMELKKEVAEMIEGAKGENAFQKAYDLHMNGKIDKAIIAHQKAAEFADHKGIATYNLGCAWVLTGEIDKAFAALNDAVTFGFHDVNQYQIDEDLDPIRKDPRFEKLMDRLQKAVGFSFERNAARIRRNGKVDFESQAENGSEGDERDGDGREGDERDGDDEECCNES